MFRLEPWKACFSGRGAACGSGSVRSRPSLRSNDMNSKAFEMLLDRLGADFDAWPSDEAREAKALLATSAEARQAYDMLLRIEGLLEASRPRVPAGAEQVVIRRALANIALREASPTLLDRFRALLFAP